MHLVLDCLKRDAGEDAGGLDPLCRARLSVAGEEAVLEDLVERMLDTCKALGRVVVLVMDMQVVAFNRFLHIL